MKNPPNLAVGGYLGMVGVGRIELPTPAMSTQCSTTELYAHDIPASRLSRRAGVRL